MEVNQFEVYLVNLDLTVGREIKKTPPCVIISPNEMNRHIGTVIVAPMTTQGNDYPTRIPCHFQGKSAKIIFDQIRTIDKTRLVKRLGKLTLFTSNQVSRILTEMFQK